MPVAVGNLIEQKFEHFRQLVLKACCTQTNNAQRLATSSISVTIFIKLGVFSAFRGLEFDGQGQVKPAPHTI